MATPLPFIGKGLDFLQLNSLISTRMAAYTRTWVEKEFLIWSTEEWYDKPHHMQ